MILNKSKPKKIFKISLSFFFIAVFLIIIAYIIATSRVFIKKFILPLISEQVGVNIEAENIDLSLLLGKAKLSTISAGPKGAPFLKAEAINLQWDNYALISGKIKIISLRTKNLNILFEEKHDGKNNLQCIESKEKAKDEIKNDKNDFQMPEISVNGLNMENTSVSYRTLNYDSSIKNEISLKNLNINMPFFAIGSEAKLVANGSLLIKSGNLVNFNSDELKTDFSFLIGKDLIPDKATINMNASAISGTINGNSIDTNEFSVNCAISEKQKSLLIEHFTLSELSKNKQELSNIKINGTVGFSPLFLDSDIKVKPLGRNLVNMIASSCLGVSPADTVLFYDGKLTINDKNCFSSGNVKIIHNEMSKNIIADMAVDYSMLMSLEPLTVELKKLDADMNINNNKCFSVNLKAPASINNSNRSEKDLELELVIEKMKLIVLNNFMQNDQIRIEEGELSGLVLAKLSQDASSIILNGNVSANDLSLSIDNYRTPKADLSLSLSETKFESFSKMQGNFSLELLQKGQKNAKISTKIAMDFNNISGEIKNMDYQFNSKLLDFLPKETMSKIYPHEFEISGQGNFSFEDYFSNITAEGKVNPSKISGIANFADFEFANMSFACKYSFQKQKDEFKNIKLDFTANDLKYKKGDFSVQAIIDSTVFDPQKQILAIKSLNSSVNIKDCPAIFLNLKSPCSLYWGKELLVEPELSINLKTSDFPLSQIHRFFEPSDGFTAKNGKGMIDIRSSFAKNFVLEKVKANIVLKNFSFRAVGLDYANICLENSAELSFPKWTHMIIDSSESVFSTNSGVIMGRLLAKADCNFNSASGDISFFLSEFNPQYDIFPASMAYLCRTLSESETYINNGIFRYSESGSSLTALAGGNLNFPNGKKLPIESDCSLKFTNGKIEIEKLNLNSKEKLQNPLIDLKIRGEINPSLYQYKINADANIINIGEITDLFVPHNKKSDDTKTEKKSEQTQNIQQAHSVIKNYDLKFDVSVKELSYFDLRAKDLKLSATMKESLINVNNLNTKIGEGTLSASGYYDLSLLPIVSYEAKLEIKNTDLTPLLKSLTEDEKTPAPHIIIDSLSLNAKNMKSPKETPFENIHGILNANFAKINIPVNIRKKSLMVNIILIPLDIIAIINDFIPNKYLSKDFRKISENLANILKNFESINFSKGQISLVAKDRNLSVNKFNLEGKPIDEIKISGDIRTTDGTMSLNTSTKMAGLIVPLKISGTVVEPEPGYKLLLPDFLKANAGNLLNSDNVGDLIKATKDAGNEIKNTIEDILGGMKKKKK